jgi:hypothetical protein
MLWTGQLQGLPNHVGADDETLVVAVFSEGFQHATTWPWLSRPVRLSRHSWLKNDPAFDAEVEQAAAQPAVKLFNTIREQAPETWQSGAWALERRYPEMFAKPEAQLNIVATAQAAAINGARHNVQMVVVSDLEFVGLKRHPAYTHRPGVREAEQVPSELSGTLVRENENIVVTSESRARATAERHARIRARAIELVDTCQANKGNGQTGAAPAPIVEEAVSAQVSAAPKDGAPAPESLPSKSSSWWHRFLFPVVGMLIPRTDAILALKLVLKELGITPDQSTLDFQTESITQGTFCKALERLTGSELGLRRASQIYERQQARERIWADH